MPRGTKPRPSGQYSRLDNVSDEDENDAPLLSMEEALGNPEPDHYPHKSRDRFAPHERTFKGFQSAILRFYHLQKIAFLAYLLAVLIAIVFIGIYLRHIFREPSFQTCCNVCLQRLDSSSPSVIELKPAYFPQFGSRRVRIKYGPYTVPPSSMVDFQEQKSIKPCEDCLITFMQAGLEYPNGSYANADSGIWLHHVVQVDTAVDDTVCGKNVTGHPMSPNRFFASGNERSPVHLSAQGYTSPFSSPRKTHY